MKRLRREPAEYDAEKPHDAGKKSRFPDRSAGMAIDGPDGLRAVFRGVLRGPRATFMPEGVMFGQDAPKVRTVRRIAEQKMFRPDRRRAPFQIPFP